MAVFRIFATKRTVEHRRETDECTIKKDTVLLKEIVAHAQDEIMQQFHELAEKIILGDENVVCVCLCKEEVSTLTTDIYNRVITRHFRPRTVEELDNAYGLEGIHVGNDYYYVYSTTNLVEEDEDEGIQAGFSCFYMDDESPYFQFFTFEELANRTDVCLYETEVV